MKVCIPVENKNGIQSKVYGHFGSAPYFFIYDINEKTHTIIDNANSHHSHGNCHPLGALKAYDFSMVFCRGMGQRAFQRLNQAGIKAYICGEETVEGVLKKYDEGILQEITDQIACRGHSCH